MSKSSCYWECIRATHTTWKSSLRTVNTMTTGNRKRKAKGALLALCQCLSRIIEEKQARLTHNTSAKITLTSDRAGVGAQNIRLWFNTQHHTTTWTPPTTGLRTSVLFLFRFGLVYFCLNMLLYQKDVLI